MNIANFRSEIQDLKCSRLYWLQWMEEHVHQVQITIENRPACSRAGPQQGLLSLFLCDAS